MRAVLDAMAWRHHDSDVSDPVPEGGFSASGVQVLTEQVVDLRPVPTGLLFLGGLASTWDFPGFCPVFKDTEGHGGDSGEGSRPATKRQKTAARKDGSAASKATSSPEPLRIINPTNPSAAVAETAESREDHSPCVSPRGSADHSVHNYDAHHGDGEGGTLRLGAFRDPSERGNVEEGESSRRGHVYVPDWAIHQRCRLDTPMWCRELMVHLAPPAAQMKSNALNNTIALERACHAECGDLAEKLVQSRLDVKHSSDLYNSLSDQFKAFRSDHEACVGKLEASKIRNRELSQVNKDQALRIKELEDTLAKKDSALVYSERLSTERAEKKEKLVTQLGKTEMEKFDCVRKLLPIVVERLLQSHEYKCSLSEPFNLAIQAGWGKGLAEERSKEALLELMGRMEGFDVHTDTKMKVEYDKLFKKRYPYVEKISCGFRHSISDLLKVYPDSPPPHPDKLPRPLLLNNHRLTCA
ncbi:hypothetical protein Tco_1507865 [Tanacetum coccineum]